MKHRRPRSQITSEQVVSFAPSLAQAHARVRPPVADRLLAINGAGQVLPHGSTSQRTMQMSWLGAALLGRLAARVEQIRVASERGLGVHELLFVLCCSEGTGQP